MGDEDAFLKWAEQALQVGPCEVGLACHEAGAGVWYVMHKCKAGHKSTVYACCLKCGKLLVDNREMGCKTCGIRLVGSEDLLILAKVQGEGLWVTTFREALKKLES